MNRIVSFGSQINGKEMSWVNIIRDGGSSVVADILRELELETERCGAFLESFMQAEEFAVYFREAQRDTNTLPSDAKATAASK